MIDFISSIPKMDETGGQDSPIRACALACEKASTLEQRVPSSAPVVINPRAIIRRLIRRTRLFSEAALREGISFRYATSFWSGSGCHRRNHCNSLSLRRFSEANRQARSPVLVVTGSLIVSWSSQFCLEIEIRPIRYVYDAPGCCTARGCWLLWNSIST